MSASLFPESCSILLGLVSMATGSQQAACQLEGSMQAGLERRPGPQEEGWNFGDCGGGTVRRVHWEDWKGLDGPVEMSHETLFPFKCVNVEVDEDPRTSPLRFLNSQTTLTSVHL